MTSSGSAGSRGGGHDAKYLYGALAAIIRWICCREGKGPSAPAQRAQVRARAEPCREGM